MKIALVLLASISVGCTTTPVQNQLTPDMLVSTWANKKSSFIDQSGRDICRFEADHSFTCTNYPKIGDLILPLTGLWSLEGDYLIINLHGEVMVLKVRAMKKDTINLISEDGTSHVYHKQK